MTQTDQAGMLFDVQPPEPPPYTAPEGTERHMLDLLHTRYSAEAGNGPRYVCAEHVRNRAGFDANRTCDFIAMDTWPSSGLLLHGHEVKCSRTDWQRELADPTKAEAFMKYMDRWWLAVPSLAIVRNDLPKGWGLLAPNGRGGLGVAVPAQPLQPHPIHKGLLATLLRSAATTATRRTEATRG